MAKAKQATVTLSADQYWKFKATVLEAQQVEQRAQQAVREAREAVDAVLREVGLESGNYTLSDADLSVTKA